MQFKGKITNKLPQVGTTIFTVMSALAAEHNAVNLSQGFPDFDVNPRLLDLVSGYMRAGKNQYAPMPGVKELRYALSDKIKRTYGAEYDPDQEITITAGGTQALATSIFSTIREGDEVILFTPAYDSYAPMIELAGGTPIYVQLKFPDYKVDWEHVKRVINRKTRMIVINTPNNPTGSLWSKEDMNTLSTLIDGTEIILICDEVYEHIVFDGKFHESVMAHPKLAARSFVVFSFGKTFHATGWKLGYVLAPGNLMAEFRKIHQYEVFSCNAPIQYALAEYMQDPFVFNIASMYQQKRDFFLDVIKGSRFKPLHSSGTYFQLLDYSAITDELDVDFSRRMTIENGLASIPVSVFYNVKTDNKVLRFCFAKENCC